MNREQLTILTLRLKQTLEITVIQISAMITEEIALLFNQLHLRQNKQDIAKKQVSTL